MHESIKKQFIFTMTKYKYIFLLSSNLNFDHNKKEIFSTIREIRWCYSIEITILMKYLLNTIYIYIYIYIQRSFFRYRYNHMNIILVSCEFFISNDKNNIIIEKI